MVLLDESDSMGLTYTTKRAAMDSMVEEINATGGLGNSGRPIELVYCVTQFDPNLAQQCARDAVADESILALVGMITNYPDQVNPILEEAGMASVGTEPYGVADGTSPISFPITAGYLSSVAGMGTVLADVGGATQISVIHVDVPSAQASVDTIRRALEPRGLELVNAIPVPIGKADVSAETAAALENSDGLALLTDPATASGVIQAMTQQGNVVPVGAAGGQFSAEALAGLGEAADGMLLANWFASDDQDVPGVQEFLRIMETYDTLDHSDDLAKSGYTAMLLLDEAVRGLETIDRASILANLTEMDDFDTGGLTPTIDFTAPGPLEIEGEPLPRFVNPTVMYGRVADARVAAVDGTFVDPFVAP
jgi:ABC-type branched-subunit amino acid transport system substrate-binding protein